MIDMSINQFTFTVDHLGWAKAYTWKSGREVEVQQYVRCTNAATGVTRLVPLFKRDHNRILRPTGWRDVVKASGQLSHLKEVYDEP